MLRPLFGCERLRLRGEDKSENRMWWLSEWGDEQAIMKNDHPGSDLEKLDEK